MKLDAYRRVSRVGGRNGDSFISPEQQRDKIRDWAKLRDVRIAKWHEPDLDQSGGKLSRPNFDKALERVRAGKTDGIVVAKLDRFSRAGVADALKLIEGIIEAGGTVASVEEGIDPTTPTGEFTMTLFLALARMQRRQIAANWKDAQERAVARGIHIASKAPTGYDRDKDGRLVPNDDAPRIAELFGMKAVGASWRELTLFLREHNVVSPYGTTHWQAGAIRSIIENRAYLGEARSGEFTNPDAHEPLIDVETWEAAQTARMKPANSLGGALLSRLLKCGGCGRPLKGDTMRDRSGEKLRLYRCRGEDSSGRCKAPASVLGRVVEPFVVDAFLAYAGTIRAEGSTLTAELRAAETAADRAERELVAWLELEAHVERDDWLAGYRKRREARDSASERLDEALEKAGLADVPSREWLAGHWHQLELREQRQLLRSAIELIVLDTGRAPIEQRAHIVFKGDDLPPGFDWQATGKRMALVSGNAAPAYEQVLRDRHPGAAWTTTPEGEVK